MNNLLKSKNTIYLILTSFFFHQIFYIYVGGTTYDTNAIRYVCKKLIMKLLLMLQGDFSNPELTNFIIGEEFGFILWLPAYLFGHSINLFNKNFQIPLINELFFTEDSLINYGIHLILNIYVVTFLYIAYKFLSSYFDRIYANLFILFLIFTPSFTGHSMFNLKDIPFALNLLICTLYLLTKFEILEKSLDFKNLLVPAFFISLPSLIRINGYLFSGFVVFYLIIVNFKRLKVLNLLRLFSIYLISFIIFFITHPQGWFAPLNFINRTIQHQFNHKWNGATLTNGEFILAQEMTGDYLLIWFFNRLPIPIILSFVFALFLILRKYNFSQLFNLSLVFITSVFVMFSILRPTAYDGLRHFIFLVPFFVIILVEVFQYYYKKINFGFGFFAITILYFIFTQFGLKEMKYSYFNEFTNTSNIGYFCVDNIDGCGNWSTDYWAFSGKSVAKELNSMEIDKDVIVCKPNHAVNSYLNKNIKTLDIEIQDKEKVFNLPNSFIVVSFHRPRFFSDSCYFSSNDIQFYCKNLVTINRRLRNSELPMSYINECNLS